MQVGFTSNLSANFFITHKWSMNKVCYRFNSNLNCLRMCGTCCSKITRSTARYILIFLNDFLPTIRLCILEYIGQFIQALKISLHERRFSPSHNNRKTTFKSVDNFEVVLIYWVYCRFLFRKSAFFNNRNN